MEEEAPNYQSEKASGTPVELLQSSLWCGNTERVLEEKGLVIVK